MSRQAFYKSQKVAVDRFLKERITAQAVRDVRKRQPKVGGRKLQKMLPQAEIQVGRDRLFEILRENDLLVKPTKNYRKTTNSFHRFRKYTNLIKDLPAPTAPNQVFVGDITYLETLEGFCYLSLVTDLYSRKIVGWDLSRSLSIEGSLKALQKALKGVDNPRNLIHHSDRGIQYCSKVYTNLLESVSASISMTEENHCYENAVAERVNGILKTEFLLGEKLRSFDHASRMTDQAINIYNNERLHCSLNYRTPEECYAA